MRAHAAIQPHAEIMTQSQCVMMTDTNGPIFCRTGKEAQVWHILFPRRCNTAV